ncbi:MAG: flagellar biosynthesis protein FlhB [Pseudomonadota bacterium]
MAASENGQERTEEPTERKLRQAREQGQIPRSREFNTMFIMMAGAVALWTGGQVLIEELLRLMSASFSVERGDLLAPHFIALQLKRFTMDVSVALMPLMIIMLVVALFSPILLGGWSFSLQAMSPKFERVSPLAGIKRMFSARSAMELLKSILKVGLVGAIFYVLFLVYRDEILAMGDLPLRAALVQSAELLLLSFAALSAGLIAVAAIDAPFQVWQFTQQQRMTLQEVKDESKETEGRPEVKQRVRQLQSEFARARMMTEVPKADVIITNPTHFAVALKYKPKTMDAPVVVAKGTDLVAERIRDIAKQHRVPIVSAPPLARAVYYTTPLMAAIPGALYVAVAQVLAFVVNLRNARRNGDPLPKPPNPEIPDGFLDPFEPPGVNT